VTLKGPPQACIFVASLTAETTEEKIRSFFTYFGTVLKVRLLRDRSLKPYAFVQFSKTEEADAVLGNTPIPLIIDNRKVRVERAKVNRTLFVTRLSQQINEKQLREIAEEYGVVEEVTIIKNFLTNRSKGCGYIKYTYREDAADAFASLKLVQKKWTIEWAANNSEDPIDKQNVFVGNLNPRETTKELVQTRFERYGLLESLTFVNPSLNPTATSSSSSSPIDTPPEEPSSTLADASSDPANKKKSAFAFVRYVEPAGAALAIENENGVDWCGRRVRVQYCETPETKSKRRAPGSSSPLPGYPFPHGIGHGHASGPSYGHAGSPPTHQGRFHGHHHQGHGNGSGSFPQGGSTAGNFKTSNSYPAPGPVYYDGSAGYPPFYMMGPVFNFPAGSPPQHHHLLHQQQQHHHQVASLPSSSAATPSSPLSSSGGSSGVKLQTEAGPAATPVPVPVFNGPYGPVYGAYPHPSFAMYGGQAMVQHPHGFHPSFIDPSHPGQRPFVVPYGFGPHAAGPFYGYEYEDPSHFVVLDADDDPSAEAGEPEPRQPVPSSSALPSSSPRPLPSSPSK